jgi:hypothetical protein
VHRLSTANRNVLHVGTHALRGQVSGKSPVGTPVTSGNTRWNANGRLRGAREFAALRRLLLIHAEIRTAGDDDCPVSWSSTASTVWTVDHAVVVGAGIGGLTASLVLSRVATRVTLCGAGGATL